MSLPKPHFELARVYDDGSRESEIVSVVGLPWDTKMDRRGFLGAGATAGTVLGALTAACAPARVAKDQRPQSISRPDPFRPANQDCGGLKAHWGSVLALAAIPEGKLLASGGADKAIKLWSLPEGALRKTLVGHKNSIHALASSPDGKLLASGSSDNTVMLWDLPQGALRKTLPRHKGAVKALAFSPDSKLLASGGDDRTISIWSLPDGVLRKTLGGDKGPVIALAISPDGKVLASAGGNERVMPAVSSDVIIRLWNLQDGLQTRTLEGHKSPVTALAISPDGKLLASGSTETTIKLWSLPDGLLLSTLQGHRRSVRALAITPDGKLLASGSDDGNIRLWSLPNGLPAKAPAGHKNSVAALAISPDGALLASAGSDQTIKLWNLPEGESRSCVVDWDATPPAATGVTYEYRNEYGQVVTYTLPCGSPIPPGAVCTCNCVPGTYRPPAIAPAPAPAAPSTGGGRYCTCVPVCVCMAVPVCQAHRVLHEETVVRTMAEELLLLMGTQEFEYMAWAADKAEPPLSARIREIMREIEAGALSDPGRWPTTDECIARLDDPDDVVALMAAQMLAQKTVRRGLRLDDELSRRVNELIREANERSPFPKHCPECAVL